MKKLLPLGVDDGHACIDLFGKTVSNKPISQVILSRAALGNAGSSNFEGDAITNCYQIKGEKWVVGDNILVPMDTRINSFPGSNHNAALIVDAINRTSLGGNANVISRGVHIVTGLPIKHYYKGKTGELNKELIDKKRKTILGKYYGSNGECVVNIKKHDVMAEGVAGWLSYQVNNGIKSSEAPKWVVVIDFGGRTVDIALISPGSSSINHEFSGSIDLGVLTILDVVKEVSGMENISPSVFDDAMDMFKKTDGKKASVPFNGTQVDIATEINEGITRVGQMIKSECERMLKSAIDNVGLIVGVGGGAKLFKEHLPFTIEVPPNAHLANAEGLYFKANSYVLKGS